MPWLRVGDNAATYPLLLAVAAVEGADDRLLNEVGGWLWRCATASAGHMTNGVIDAGTAALFGGSRTGVLVKTAVSVGLLHPVAGSTPPAWRLIDDPEFLHIRDRDAVMWERQRDRDRKNPQLTAHVRLRDGDACRYCGQVVDFRARKGGRSGTYDHTEPGQAATPETYVVCCRTCNSKMGDGERLPLLPAPTEPYYAEKTRTWLDDHGLTPQPGRYRSEPARPTDELTEGGHRRDLARPASAPDPAANRRDPDAPDPDAAERDPGATGGPRSDHARPFAQWVYDEGLADPPEPPEPEGGDGSGRVGTGRAGPGRDGPGRGRTGAQTPRQGRRGRRGRRRGGPAGRGGSR